MSHRANTLSPLHGSAIWSQSPEAIWATAAFLADTRTLSSRLCRNVDLGLRLSLEIARAVRAEARAHRLTEHRAWERVERDAERVVASLHDSDPAEHWWDTFEALSLSLGNLAEGMSEAIDEIEDEIDGD